MPAKTRLSLRGRASDTAVRLSDIVWSPAFADVHLRKRTPSERLGSCRLTGSYDLGVVRSNLTAPPISMM